jgi:SIR2-like protein
MLLVIFGAGASFDSVPTYPPGAVVLGADPLNNFHRPPLANELFENRPVFAEAIARLPECQPIVQRLRSLKGESLEAALQDLQAKAKDYPRGLQQLAAVRYYLQYILWQCSNAWRDVAKGVTNYKTLLDQIERANKKNEPVCLVTFNYDTLLEDALSDFGLPIEDFSDYTKKHPFYRVFKVHGSVNWARIVENEIQSQNPTHAWSVTHEWIQRAAELRITDNYVLSTDYPTAVVGGRPAFPAIAIPVEKEKNFECPPNLIEELKGLLPQTSKALAIGWRATEEHFLYLLKTHLQPGVRLHVVAGGLKDAEDAKVSIYRALMNSRPSRSSLSDEGFSDFILSGRAEEFLAE